MDRKMTDRNGEALEDETIESDPLARGYHQAVRRYQHWLIQEALARCDGRHNKAADLLGLNRTYLSRLRTQFGLR
jgi:DNA-binding NtrC family response regulator